MSASLCTLVRTSRRDVVDSSSTNSTRPSAVRVADGWKDVDPVKLSQRISSSAFDSDVRLGLLVPEVPYTNQSINSG